MRPCASHFSNTCWLQVPTGATPAVQRGQRAALGVRKCGKVWAMAEVVGVAVTTTTVLCASCCAKLLRAKPLPHEPAASPLPFPTSTLAGLAPLPTPPLVAPVPVPSAPAPPPAPPPAAPVLHSCYACANPSALVPPPVTAPCTSPCCACTIPLLRPSSSVQAAQPLYRPVPCPSPRPSPAPRQSPPQHAARGGSAQPQTVLP